MTGAGFHNRSLACGPRRQMVTAASPLFTMALMFLATGKRYSRTATCAMVPMCGGVMMCTAGELNFHMLGFLACIAATILRGVKSIAPPAGHTAVVRRMDGAGRVGLPNHSVGWRGLGAAARLCM